MNSLTYRMLAALILSFAEPGDTDAVRRLLYNYKGVLNETFALVEVPNVLLAGFYHTLGRLQDQYASSDEIAFSSIIASTSPNSDPTCPPPAYAQEDHFEYQLNIICKAENVNQGDPYTLRLSTLLSNGQKAGNVVDELCCRTTLDRGQATALCETLCRGLAFTQGPPGMYKRR